MRKGYRLLSYYSKLDLRACNQSLCLQAQAHHCRGCPQHKTLCEEDFHQEDHYAWRSLGCVFIVYSAIRSLVLCCSLTESLRANVDYYQEQHLACATCFPEYPSGHTHKCMCMGRFMMHTLLVQTSFLSIGLPANSDQPLGSSTVSDSSASKPSAADACRGCQIQGATVIVAAATVKQARWRACLLEATAPDGMGFSSSH